MKSQSPAFLFYTNDFISATQFFSHEQVGKYIRLLCAQHQHGPLTEKQMLMICGTHDVDVFSKFIPDGHGKFHNERMNVEIQKRENYSKSRSANRTKSKSTTSVSDMNIISSTHVDDMENENENEIEKRKLKFANHIRTLFGISYPETMIDEFIAYWCEHNPKGKKMRFEMEKVFEPTRRLATWNRNNKINQNNGKQITTNNKQQRIDDVEQLRISAINTKNAIIGSNQHVPETPVQ